MNNNINREICNMCSKQIYLHDYVVVCAFKNCIYHGKCLKFDNNTVFNIQNIDDWFCPICLADTLPLFNCDSKDDVVNVKCHVCTKFISIYKHQIVNCSSCNCCTHTECSSNNICKFCLLPIDNLISSEICNPYNIEDCDSGKFFDDNSELDTEIIKSASKILEDCDYIDNIDFIFQSAELRVINFVFKTTKI